MSYESKSRTTLPEGCPDFQSAGVNNYERSYVMTFGYNLQPPGYSIRRKVFISYHHRGDQAYYDTFSRVFHDKFELITDSSLERAVESADVEYIMRRIREHHLTGSSCTLVLCGLGTAGRKYVDWEIMASLNQQMGLVGVKLPSLLIQSNGGTNKPARLQDNIDSGYAEWVTWENLGAQPESLREAVERANAKSWRLIVNTRSRMQRNA
jgi:hypothetical protein